jgi:hypothetical protein
MHLFVLIKISNAPFFDDHPAAGSGSWSRFWTRLAMATWTAATCKINPVRVAKGDVLLGIDPEARRAHLVSRIKPGSHRSMNSITRCTLSACAALFFVFGCDDKPAPTAASAAPSATLAPAPAPTPEAAKPAPKTEFGRPEKLDLTLTPERRTAIESKYPAEKGFLLEKELEEKLQKNKALKDEKTALAAFDKLAKGKWILFTGNAANLAASNFDMGVVYTPQIAGDSIGMSKQWFPVHMSDIEGYQKDALKTGDMVVVLVKYDGAGKVSPGQELVATGVWK